MKTPVIAIVVVARDPESADAEPSDVVEAQEVHAPEASSREASPTEPETVAVGGAGVMPDVVGMNLQRAQDHIQAVTELWFSDSRDATGEGRMQIVDSNWVVIGQSPAAGTALSDDDVPMLDVVKIGER